MVDAYTSNLISSVAKMFDILQESVTGVEMIEQPDRSDQPAFEVCYILCPTTKNVDRIIQDLAPGGDLSRGKYAAAHVFFIDGLSDQLIQRLTRSPAEPKLKQLVELFCNIWTPESQVFSLKTPQSFYTLFQPLSSRPFSEIEAAQQALEEELIFTTQTLLNVCVTLNEFPQIRYYNPSHPPLGVLAPPETSPTASSSNSGVYAGSARMARLRDVNGATSSIPPAPQSLGDHFTKRLAFRLQAAIDDYVRENQPKPDPGRPRGMLFITDRSMDIVAPLLHEFSYQAMCNDLLHIEDGLRYHYRFTNSSGVDEDKEATLSDEDTVWRGIRHLHIAEAIQKLSEDFKMHAGQQGHYAEGNSLNDMRDMLASLPHMQEMKEKLSLHLTMAQNCMNTFEKTKLSQQANVEQCCATRITPDGSKPKTLVEEMVPLLDDRSVTNADKVRIIALYIMYCDGVPDEDRKRLFQHARLGLQEMDAVNNLVLLGARVVKQPATSAWDTWFKKRSARKQPYRENEFELSRYQPLLKLMLEDHCTGKLEQTTYPYVRDAPPDLSGSANSLVSQASSAGNSALARVGITSASSSPSSGGARPAPSSLRSAKPTWHQKPRVGAATSGSLGSAGGASLRGAFSGDDSTRQRFIVFVAGGMTYSEIRTAYQSTNTLGKDVYLGSSHTFTPDMYIDCLKSLAQGPPRHHNRHLGHGLDNGGLQAQHHYPGGPQLPSGASMLSKPANDVSGLRTRSDGARGNSGSAHPSHHPHEHHQPQNSPGASQETYDRRFFTPSPGPAASQPQYASHGAVAGPRQPMSASSTSTTLSMGSNSGQRMHQHIQQYDARAASPSPSDLSKTSKEKKKMKVSGRRTR